MAEKKKINWLLILQGWAMLWVVIGHCPLEEPGMGPEWENTLYKFAYSFHMPLFMLVSGWLFMRTKLSVFKDNTSSYRYKFSYGQIVRDKSLRLLLPGMVFSIVALVLKLAFPGEMTRQTGLSFHEIAHGYLYPYDNAMRELWFIVTLFWLMMLAPVWRFMMKDSRLMVAGLVVLTVLHFWHPNVELLCLGKVMNMAIWFFLGMVMCKSEVVENFLERRPLATLVAGIMVYVAGLLAEWSFVKTVGGIDLSFGLALLADKYVPRLFFLFRNYTYQIFLMGIFAQIAVKILYRHFEMLYVAGFILCMLVGLYVPVIVSKIIERIDWKPLSLCVGLKRNNKH